MATVGSALAGSGADGAGAAGASAYGRQHEQIKGMCSDKALGHNHMPWVSFFSALETSGAGKQSQAIGALPCMVWRWFEQLAGRQNIWPTPVPHAQLTWL